MSPMFDRTCPSCGWVRIDVLEPTIFANPPCPECGEPTARAWVTKPANVIGDECDIVQENGFHHPRRFTSKSELTRALAERGQEIHVEHKGVPGSDKSPHTKSWAATGGTQWLKDAEILATRNGGNSGPQEMGGITVRWETREGIMQQGRFVPTE